MSTPLHLVPSHEDRCQLLAEIVTTMGRTIYARLMLAVQTADDMVIDPMVRSLTDRELGAAGIYAATRHEFYIGQILAFEEGRRCGHAEPGPDNDDSPGGFSAEAA